MNLRVDALGMAVKSGAQTEIGGNDRYIAMCRRHFVQRMSAAEQPPLPLELAAPVAA
jgi:thymidine kinase